MTATPPIVEIVGSVVGPAAAVVTLQVPPRKDGQGTGRYARDGA